MIRHRGSTLAAIAIVMAGALGLAAAPASATFHLMSIREVYPGTAAEPNSEYVELQMYAGGQQFVGGHFIRTYDASGAPVAINTFASNAANGANQSTILMATPQAESHFGVTADGALSASNQLDPNGGAVCWESLDCVSWGSFIGSLPSPAGSAAAVIPNEMALRRTIAPNCPTLLEAADDRNDSALDFEAVFPGPRPNSVPPAEHACSSSEGSGGGGSSPGAPQTRLRGKPPRRTHDRTPTFRFSSDEDRARFQCRVDHKPYRGCRSPFTTKRLALGRHTFFVRAREPSGQVDPSPASYSFRVIASR